MTLNFNNFVTVTLLQHVLVGTSDVSRGFLFCENDCVHTWVPAGFLIYGGVVGFKIKTNLVIRGRGVHIKYLLLSA